MELTEIDAVGGMVNPSMPYANFTSLIDTILESDDSEFNVSRNEAFQRFRESLELSRAAQAGLITLYSLAILLSIAGNLTVIVVLTLGSRSKAEISVFLLNLAVADLCMACFCMPFTFTQTMLGRWIFGGFMCPLVLFMQVTSVAVSIFTNMAIGIDRLWVVKYPLKSRLTKKWARLLVLLIWLLSGSIASIQWFVSRTEQKSYLGFTYMDCNEKWSSDSLRHTYSVIITLTTYVIPLLILGFAYYQMGAKLWERQLPGNANVARDKMMLKSKRKVIKLMATLVVVFAICWFPLQMFNFVLDLAPYLLENIRTKKDELSFVAIYYVCHWVAMANSFTNPIIFCFLNNNFRADAESILKRSVGRRRSSSPSTVNTRSFRRSYGGGSTREFLAMQRKRTSLRYSITSLTNSLEPRGGRASMCSLASGPGGRASVTSHISGGRASISSLGSGGVRSMRASLSSNGTRKESAEIRPCLETIYDVSMSLDSTTESTSVMLPLNGRDARALKDNACSGAHDQLKRESLITEKSAARRN